MKDKFQSHEKILEYLFSIKEVKRVMETGMGIYSTSLFLNKEIDVISIEMQNKEWYNKVLKEHGNKKNFDGHLLLTGKEAYDFIDSQEKFDLVFVDGRCDRWRQINHTFNKTDLIVAHDVEATCYLWERVSLPFMWKWIDIKEEQPWTGVITSDLNIVNNISKKFKCDVYDTMSFPMKEYLIYNHNYFPPKDVLIHKGDL